MVRQTIEGRVVIAQFCPYLRNQMTVYIDTGNPDPTPVQFYWRGALWSKVTADGVDVDHKELLAWLSDERFDDPGGLQPHVHFVDEGCYRGITEATFTAK